MLEILFDAAFILGLIEFVKAMLPGLDSRWQLLIVLGLVMLLGFLPIIPGIAPYVTQFIELLRLFLGAIGLLTGGAILVGAFRGGFSAQMLPWS